MCASPCLKTVSDTMQFLKRCVKLLLHLYVVMFRSMWSIKSLPRLILLTLRLFFIFPLYYLDFFFMCLEHYNFQAHFPLSKHFSSKQENLYPVLSSLWVIGTASSSPDGRFLCHVVQTCFDSVTPKRFPDGSCCSSRCDCSCLPYRTEKWSSENPNNIPEGSTTKDASSTALPFQPPAPLAGCSYYFITTQTHYYHEKQWKQGSTTFWED